jgi:hypothetical protein
MHPLFNLDMPPAHPQGVHYIGRLSWQKCDIHSKHQSNSVRSTTYAAQFRTQECATHSMRERAAGPLRMWQMHNKRNMRNGWRLRSASTSLLSLVDKPVDLAGKQATKQARPAAWHPGHPDWPCNIRKTPIPQRQLSSSVCIHRYNTNCAWETKKNYDGMGRALRAHIRRVLCTSGSSSSWQFARLLIGSSDGGV